MFRRILNCSELWIGEKKGIVVDDVPVLLVHTENGIHAFYNKCPHAGALLSNGLFKENIITCAQHGWQFEACTGKGVNPINTRLHQYQVFIDTSDDIWVDVGV